MRLTSRFTVLLIGAILASASNQAYAQDNEAALPRQATMSASEKQQCTRTTGGASADSPGITREQTQAILDELKAIHHLLEANTRTAPTPSRAPSQVRFRNDPSWPFIGRADAPLTLVEFSDYQCPFCKRFYSDTFAQIKRSFVETGVLKIVFRDLPLPMHANAVFAAEAARCAADQGRFAAMHDLLMSSRDLGKEAVLGSAREAGLDDALLRLCLDTHKFKTDIEKAASDALAQSISSTPTFVLAKTTKEEISGDVLTGAMPFSVFDAAIKRKLEVSK
jgi:protein-disulfide isomerase